MFVFHEVRERCVVGGGRAGVGVWDCRRQAWGCVRTIHYLWRVVCPLVLCLVYRSLLVNMVPGWYGVAVLRRCIAPSHSLVGPSLSPHSTLSIYTISRYLYLRAPAVDSCDSSRFASSSSMFLHPLYTLHTRIHSYTRTLIHSIHSFTPPSPPPLSLLPLLPLLRFFPPPPSAPSQGRPDERRGERRDATEFRGVAWVPLRRTCRSVDAASVADDVSLHWADRRTDC